MTEHAIVKASEVNVDEIGRIGKMLALSGYFESAQNLEVAVAQMATKVLAGREMGFGPFASANGIHIIKGKPGVGANLMASAVKSHPRYDYRVREMSNTNCKLEFFERDDSGKWESIGVSEFNEADARAAGTQNMQKFARNMLFARAMSNGVRWYCPDVFNGNAVYVPEELGAEVDGDGNVVDARYTVRMPQPQAQPVPVATNGNGHHAEDASYADADIALDMADIPEDTAGHLATPQRSNGKPAPKPKAAAAQNGSGADEKTVKLLNAMGKAAFYGDWKKKHDELCGKLGITSTAEIATTDATTTITWLRGLLTKNLDTGMTATFADDDAAKANFIATVTEWKDNQGNVRQGVRTLDEATDWNLVFLTNELHKLSKNAA